MKFDFLVVLLAFGMLWSGCLLAQDSGAQSSAGYKYVPVRTYDPARSAAADIERAIAEARKTGRRILLDIGGDWCPWCHKLDQFFQEHADVLQVREDNFVTVAVYYGSENKNEQILSHYSNILGIPHIFVLDEDGALLHSQHVVELQTGGIYNPEKVKEFLTRWSPQKTSPDSPTGR